MNKGLNLRKPPKKFFLGVFYVMAVIFMLLLVMHKNPLADQHSEHLKKICGCLLLTVGCVLVSFWYDKLTVLPIELWHNRKLIWRLSVNDFKKRYAGSVMGAVWAMVQPVVTVMLYAFVFGYIFTQKAQYLAGGVKVEYVLFLTAGLVPWFFFVEALTNGTTALLEYNYLVKKVLFKISILPLIKIIAAMFIHIFFLAVLLIMAWCMGCPPSIYWLQLIYYVGCEFILVLSISYATSALVVFFRDLLQIINIGLQLFQWYTPILWSFTDIMQTHVHDSDRLRPYEDLIKVFIKINPMAYIVEGYRNSIYGQSWFFEHFYSSTYFWMCVVVLFCIGTLLFKRLKPHFADVL
ncbi:ABC transporter permease [Butyrivibrio sp. INlla21]|uniref:ABC transporter permease n=1 Tax=Butyrivibrio sp. INlla21 TaxID=1520811 RepID=UPI0008EFA47A|nr:ABC transporter permease [Butyrivibrio sp. INlla21]SFU87545.1 teichoic acid transport system permease protein [Butyrivibrio sp. INlla21]